MCLHDRVIVIIYIGFCSPYFSSVAIWPGSGSLPPLRAFTITFIGVPPHTHTESVWFLCTSDQLVAKTSTWQHSQQKDILAHGGVVYRPIPGRECIVDFTVGRSEARTSVRTMRLRVPYRRNNVTPLHWIHMCWSLLEESCSVVIRRRLDFNFVLPCTTV